MKWKKTGASGILLNLVTGEFCEVDGTALAVWNLIDGKASAAQIASKLARTYSAPAATVEKDVTRFMAELKKRNLIEPIATSSR